MLPEKYTPKKFCKEFVEIRRHSGQLVQIMATVMGLKPLMDDWIQARSIPRYKKLCKQYGLHLRLDAVFSYRRSKNDFSEVSGKELLTTTKAFGKPLSQCHPSDSIHVFISRSKNNLEQGFRYGWYPLAINKKIIDRPLIDGFKFGYYLGYPSCCVDFFQKHNNWSKYSHFYETFRNATNKNFCYLNNPFLKDDTFSYIYHIPCSYNCSQTSMLGRKIRSAILKEEPGFIYLLDQYLCLPLLVFYERKAYLFSGSLKNDKLTYKGVCYVGQMRQNNLHENMLKKGDAVEIEGSTVIVLNRGRLTGKITCKTNGFAPEFPFFIQFHE